MFRGHLGMCDSVLSVKVKKKTTENREFTSKRRRIIVSKYLLLVAGYCVVPWECAHEDWFCGHG